MEPPILDFNTPIAYGVDHGALGWINFLDPPKALGRQPWNLTRVALFQLFSCFNSLFDRPYCDGHAAASYAEMEMPVCFLRHCSCMLELLNTCCYDAISTPAKDDFMFMSVMWVAYAGCLTGAEP